MLGFHCPDVLLSCLKWNVGFMFCLISYKIASLTILMLNIFIPCFLENTPSGEVLFSWSTYPRFDFPLTSYERFFIFIVWWASVFLRQINPNCANNYIWKFWCNTQCLCQDILNEAKQMLTKDGMLMLYTK